MRINKKLLSYLLIAVLVISAIPALRVAAADPAIQNGEDLQAAIDAIPAGGSGEITIENVTLILSSLDLFIENKDITFHLKNAQLSLSTVMFVDSNITINADDTSSITTATNTDGYGSIRFENWTWDSGAYAETFTVTFNGGRYGCADGDLCIAVCPGINTVFTDVFCQGPIAAIDMSGVDIPETAGIQINSGRYANDVSAYVPANKWCGEAGGAYYVRSTEYSEDFASILTDGKIVFDYVPPASEEDAILWLVMEEFYADHPGFELLPDSFNADYTTCQIVKDFGKGTEELHTVPILWNYDETANSSAQQFIDKFPEDRNWFFVSDLELVNYWVNHDPDSEIDSLANYSGELKQYLNNTNFLFTVEVRGGADDPFYTERIGSAKLIRDGKVYFAEGMLGARAEHAIYVPESTGDTPAELIAAAQKRIDDYIGAGKITISQSSNTIAQYYDAQIDAFDQELADYQTLLAAEQAKPQNEQDPFVIMDCQWQIQQIPQYKQYFIESFEADGDLHFLGKAAGGYFFNVEVNEETYLFVIVKDDDKLQIPEYATVDLDTKVQINSTSSEIPLDTVVHVEKLTEGTEYDRILSVLDVEDNETYDIKLHSGSLNEYVTTLANGKFQVTIPIPERFVGKTLMVYYVAADNTVTPHTVTYSDDGKTATFTTDHFSIYTLAAAGHTHDHADTWKSDATHHWHPCDCGDAADKAAHSFGDWTVTRQPSVTEKGSREAVCSVCQHKAIEEIAKLTAPEDKDPSPPTGDSAHVLIGVLLAATCLMGLTAAVEKKKEI